MFPLLYVLTGVMIMEILLRLTIRPPLNRKLPCHGNQSANAVRAKSFRSPSTVSWSLLATLFALYDKVAASVH